MTLQFSGCEICGILLDIEGTTSSIAYVHDEMFPFARKHVDAFVPEHWDEPDVAAAVDQIITDSGGAVACKADAIIAEVHRLMDGDVKATGLKQLQGIIWKSGYDTGELKSHIYPDVPPVLKRWHDDGVTLRIYSSGSVAAQKLFFGHTVEGDLLPLISGHDDTTIGRKREVESYGKIAAKFDMRAEQLLFISDIVEELDAAREAGYTTILSIRPGNHPVEHVNGHEAITSFDEIG